MRRPRPRPRLRASLALASAVVLLLACRGLAHPAADPPSAWSGAGDHRGLIEHGGRERSFLLHVPPGEAAGPRPLVVALHGGGGTADRIQGYSRFDALADREGFCVLYPEAFDHHWNDGRKDIHTEAHQLDVDDVGFVTAAIDAVAAQVAIDPRRVYVCGASNGAMMTFRLALEAPTRFAAAATLIGSIPEPLAERAPPGAPLPILILAGTEDGLVPFDGGEVRVLRRGRGRVIPVPKAVAFWVARNGASEEPTVETLPDRDPEDGTRVRVERHAGPAPVWFYAVEGGGHTWPGATAKRRWLLKQLIGRTSRDLDATEELWRFFQAHVRS